MQPGEHVGVRLLVHRLQVALQRDALELRTSPEPGPGYASAPLRECLPERTDRPRGPPAPAQGGTRQRLI
jgi:hypothetical protein